MINWKTSKSEFELITQIAARAVAIAKANGIDYEQQTAIMDITATHCNGCRLNLRDLLVAEQFDFIHDVFGIHRHINRETGALENCFTPRMAKRG